MYQPPTRRNIINNNQLVMWNVGFGSDLSRGRYDNQPQFWRMNQSVQRIQLNEFKIGDDYLALIIFHTISPHLS